MRRLLTTIIFACAALSMWAQGVKPLPSLHVEGRFLVDKHGNHVVLHGVMDTPSAWFNGGRWGWSYDNAGRLRCLNYFEKLFTGLEEAKCDVFRLHLEPAWTNDPSSTYVYKGSEGQPDGTTGEADIKKFNPNRLNAYMKTLYFPLAQKAMNHGMFVVMRPPGVCPHDLKVGDYYQQYLITVWDIVTRNDSIRKYAGQISIELANEPVNVKNKNNVDDKKALHDYFQPIVDKIRENGFTGIIWVPGTGWQSNYTSYATYPVTGSNIGYAVHDYDGWYGCADSNLNESNIKQAMSNKITQFRNQVPVVTKYPIIITEVDWSPKKPGEGHYDEHGKWVEPNYGTWATGRTSMWGRCYKAVLDYYKNISMTLSGTACLIDIDTLINKNKVVPAFGGLEEACGKACMDWYAEYWKVDWPHSDVQEGTPEYETSTALQLTSDTYTLMVGERLTPQFSATYLDGHKTDVTGEVTLSSSNPNVLAVNGAFINATGDGQAVITANYTDLRGNTQETIFNLEASYLPLTARYVNASLKGNGIFNETIHAMKPAADGEIGWVYSNRVDWSGYKYLIVKLRQAQTSNAHINIYTTTTLSDNCFSSDPIDTSLQFVINLQEACYTSGSKQGQPLDLKNIGIVSFWGNGNGFIQIDDIYLTNNDDYSPQAAAIARPLVQQNAETVNVYTLSGQLVRQAVSRSQAVSGLTKGIYIVGGKKIVVNQ